MATDIIARGMAAGVVSQVSADRQAVSEDREVVEAAKTEVLNVAESIPEDYSTLSANVSELKEDLTHVFTTIDISNISFTSGGYIATNVSASAVIDTESVTTSAGYAYAVANCKSGDVFNITGVGGGTPRLWAFLDDQNKLISKSDSNITAEGLKLVAPFNASKIIVNINVPNLTEYHCWKYPSELNGNVKNEVKIDVAFAPSKAIVTNGDGVAYTTNADGTIDFTKTNEFAYACAVIPCQPEQRIKITGTGVGSKYMLWTFVNKNGTVISKSSADATLVDGILTVPDFAAYCIINVAMSNTFSATIYYLIEENHGAFTFADGYITTAQVNSAINYTPVSSADFKHTVVDCVEGQKFKLTGVTQNNSGRRLYCFVDLFGYCRYRYDSTTELINETITAPLTGKFVVNVLANKNYYLSDEYPYSLRSPISSLPPAFMGSMAFKPMGALSKGYICMMTDDGYDNGTHGLVQETIPLAISKEVPFTFALMRDSDVCKDSSKLATVIDAIENHGCSVAQHGEFVWNDKSEDLMNTFFDLEKAFFDENGIELRGAVIPAHYTTELVKAICGGRFGVVRSGYAGIVPGTQDPSGTVTNYYSYYTSGEQSNLYCLSSYNCATVTDTYNTEAVDYAYTNNKILICYFHENAMDTTKWQRVSDMIDYAKTKGLEFITLGDIPYLLNA